LNLPVYDQLAACKSILIAGAGGGFDVFCGLPIFFSLRARGQNVHLANYSFSDIGYAKGCEHITDSLVRVTADTHCPLPYFPEMYLSRWFRDERAEDVPIWCFSKTGAIPLVENYRVLVNYLGVDCVILVDGGVDCLARGDEAQVGTIVEDALSLLAVQRLTNVPVRMLACIGLGAERDICYAHILENIADLTAVGAFLGSCSLTSQMPEYLAYEKATLTVFGHTRQDPSVINGSVISAVQGHFGNYHMTEKTKGSRLWISPLMALYWMFDFQAVAERNILLGQLASTSDFQSALRAVIALRQTCVTRREARVPL
jgi:Uncharacterized protein conserved in archaea